MSRPPSGRAGPGEPFLTIEPLLEVLRGSIEAARWRLSGLQKTTSYEYDGRWAGESTRSAYLFFHPEEDEDASIDVFLDETSQGLSGSITLVLGGPTLADLGDVQRALDLLCEAASSAARSDFATSLSLRAGLENTDHRGRDAEITMRLRVSVPRVAIAAGERAVSAVARSATDTFEAFRASPVVSGLSLGS